MELTYKGELVTLHGDPELGEFVGETKHATFESVTWEGVTYDCKTFYWWDDPDYPHHDHVSDAVDKAEKAGEKNPSEAWPGYLEWEDGSYCFKVTGFMVIPYPVEGGIIKELDVLPDNSLGRIELEDLQRE